MPWNSHLCCPHSHELCISCDFKTTNLPAEQNTQIKNQEQKTQYSNLQILTFSKASPVIVYAWSASWSFLSAY